MAVAKIAPPARHMKTCIGPASRGVIMGIIMKRSIPPNRDRRMDIQLLLFEMTLMSRKMATNTPIRKIFASMHMIRPGTPATPRVKGSPAMLPPITAPIKKAIRNSAPATNPRMVFEAT